MTDDRMQVDSILNSPIPSSEPAKRRKSSSGECPSGGSVCLPILMRPQAHLSECHNSDAETWDPDHATSSHSRKPQPSRKNTEDEQHMCKNSSHHIKTLPPRDIISRCLASFFRGYGLMFSFSPEVQIMRIFQTAYSPVYRNHSTDPVEERRVLTNAEYSLLMLSAAVGALYLDESDRVARDLMNELFENGKRSLHCALRGCVGEMLGDGERRAPILPFQPETGVDPELLLVNMSGSALAALYLIFDKSILARKYMEQAIQLALSRGINNSSAVSKRIMNGVEHTDRSSAAGGDLDSWRRVWKSLVFLDGWLSASVGFRPITDPTTFTDDCFNTTGEINEIDLGLHTEMAKLGILMSAITRDVCAPKLIDMVLVRGYNEQLKTWHDNLPNCLKLSEALEFRSDSAHRTSILLTHCAYLGSLILLTRRILVAQTKALRNEVQDIVINAVENETVKLSHDCIFAARQLATVVGIFFMEGRLVRKCWLGIQSAFTSCLVIFLELAVLRRDFGTQPQQADVELVSRCMYVLEYCAVADAVARSCFNALAPIRNVLFPDMPPSLTATPSSNSSYQRFQFSPQYRSNSFSSPATSVRSRSPSTSPSKRPRLLSTSAASTYTRRSTSQSVPTSPSHIPPYPYSSATHAMRAPSISNPLPMQQMFGGAGSAVGGEVVDQAPHAAGGGGDFNIHYIVMHILEWLESPYGTESTVLNEIPPRFPPNWRFINNKTQKAPDIASLPPDYIYSSPPQADHSPMSPINIQQQPNFHFDPVTQHHASPSTCPIPPPPHPTPPSTQTQPLCHIVDTPSTSMNSPARHRSPPAPSRSSPNNPIHYRSQRPVLRHSSELKSVATTGGPLPDVHTIEIDDGGGGGDARKRRKMPFKSMEEYERFLRRVV